jgi:DNA-binding NtrC family response regulator
VEDSILILDALKMLLTEANINIVGTASTLEEALCMAVASDFDIAILDVNLHDKTVFPVADLLMTRRIPFFFATSHGWLPPPYSDIPIARKPYSLGELLKFVEQAFAQAKKICAEGMTGQP